PIGYVRWTERRNLEAFLELARGDALRLSELITHRFSIDRAAEAYGLLADDREASLAILIDYPAAGDVAAAKPPRTLPLRPPRDARFGVGFVGAGGFARAVLLPNVRAERDVALRAVVTRHGLTAKTIGDRFGFERATTDRREVLEDPSVDVLFVAGPNSTHGPEVVAALGAGKHVFVEKPLCLRLEELEEIESAVRAAPDRLLMVGFNRRFAPATSWVSQHFSAGGPEAIAIRVNAGPPPASGWAADREGEGGRLLGEVCHFVDLASCLFGSAPTSVRAVRIGTATPDDVIATLEFAGGRVCTIAYLTVASPRLPKEHIEVHGGGRTAVIDDFRSVTLYDRSRRRRGSRWSTQDKGHRAEIRAFFAALRSGSPSPIPFDESAATTRATIAIERAIREGGPVVV
ncbi:MAG: Gfo/Idh/MocA family oxidoreductase, partial [Candidatus Binatia bacterium]